MPAHRQRVLERYHRAESCKPAHIVAALAMLLENLGVRRATGTVSSNWPPVHVKLEGKAEGTRTKGCRNNLAIILQEHAGQAQGSSVMSGVPVGANPSRTGRHHLAVWLARRVRNELPAQPGCQAARSQGRQLRAPEVRHGAAWRHPRAGLVGKRRPSQAQMLRSCRPLRSRLRANADGRGPE